jgi:ABC-type polysaccharide/polyol phosphate export permease
MARAHGAGAVAGAGVLRALLKRELVDRHQGTLIGWSWGLLQPLLQFLVLAVVFTKLLPNRASANGLPYAAFLALGMWPWQMFANAILRGTTALTENAAMIGKVAIPHSYFVLTRMAGTAIYDLGGFIVVLAIVFAMRLQVTVAGLPVALLAMTIIAAHAIAVGFILATVQVFLRDAAQIVMQLVNLGFFLTPVLYDRSHLPAAMNIVLSANPMTAPIEALRAALMSESVHWHALAYSASVAVVALLVARWMFVRARPHVEDFL